MSLSPEREIGSYVLHDVETARPARMASSLLTTPFAKPGLTDPRLVDPHLEEVVDQAQNVARARGFRAGYDAGFLQGRQDGFAVLREQAEEQAARDEQERAGRVVYLDGLAAHVRAAVGYALAVRQPLLEERYDAVARAAVQIAEALVGHHLEVGDCGAHDAVMRALREVPRGARVTLRLNPADVAAVVAINKDIPEWEIGSVQADETVERQGCIAVVDSLEVDAQMSLALEHVKRVLNP